MKSFQASSWLAALTSVPNISKQHTFTIVIFLFKYRIILERMRQKNVLKSSIVNEDLPINLNDILRG